MKRINYQFLSQEEMARIHEQSLFLLENTGVSVSHHRALEMLAEAGAHVEKDTERVFFPPRLIDDCIKMSPKTVRLAAKDPHRDVVLPHPQGGFYARCNTGARDYIDFRNSQSRPITMADVIDLVQVVDALENIDLCSIQSPSDTPNETTDIHVLKTALNHTTKHIISQPHSEESIPYLIELALAAAESGTEDFKKRPIFSLIACSFSPLTFKSMDIEVMFAAGQYNIPIQIVSLPTAGGTCPVTIAGSILLSNVEVLAGLAIAQITNPGIPCILVPQKIPLSMITGVPLQGTIEGTLANAAGVELIKNLYHIPTRTYCPSSDALFPDFQSMIERTFLTILNVLGKADIISGAGQLEGAVTLSLLQLIIDNDIIGIVRKMLEGILVDDETLAADVIRQVGPGGNYLAEKHTADHCRDFYTPATFYRGNRQTWQAEGAKTITDRATEKIREILDRRQPEHLSETVRQELDRIVVKADKDIADV